MAEDKSRHLMTEKFFQKSHSEPFVSKVKKAEIQKEQYDKTLNTLLETVEKRIMREIEHAQRAATGLDHRKIEKLFATAKDKESDDELSVHRQTLTKVYDDMFVMLIDLIGEESTIDRIDVRGKRRDLRYRLATTFFGTLIVLGIYAGLSSLGADLPLRLTK